MRTMNHRRLSCIVIALALFAACGGDDDHHSSAVATWKGVFNQSMDSCEGIGPHAFPIDPPEKGPDLLVVGGALPGDAVTVLDGACVYMGSVRSDGSFETELVDPDSKCHDPATIATQFISFNHVSDGSASVDKTLVSSQVGHCQSTKLGPYERQD